ncbi:MAG: thermopsin family protease [Thermoplasmata archaeon]
MRHMYKRAIDLLVILAVSVLLMSTLGSALGSPQSITKNYQKSIEKQVFNNSEKLKIEKKLAILSGHEKLPMKYALLPSKDRRFKFNGYQVSPLYSQTPAPMGLGDFGLRMNGDGKFLPYTYKTSSFEGSIQVNSLSDFYILDSSPYSVTFQLNTVLNHVTLFGNSSYVFWNQNVIEYSSRTQQLTFIDNIWNFSNTENYISANSIYYGNGFLIPGVNGWYYSVGPTISVTIPFTVDLYLNSTVLDGDTAVYFNYTVTSSNGISVSGSYDQVLFNSTYGMPTGYVTPKPYYLVSGSEITPAGLLNDAEIMIGGPGGGSTSMIYKINALMNLYYFNSTSGTYQNVPAAFDFGTDTGETSEGVAVSWIGETAILNAGPSFLYGMWNASLSNRIQSYIGNINPPNAFFFVSLGSRFNESSASWAPLSLTGHYSFALPQGNYSAYILLSDYNTMRIDNMGSVMNTRLGNNSSLGIYTPLYAFDNSQLHYISFSGNGSLNSPYILFNNEYNSINSIFGRFNDYGYPSFLGILIANTNLHVNLVNMPSFEIVYNKSLNNFLSYYYLPVPNYLNFGFYNTSNLSLVNSQFISGWFFNSLNWNPLIANVMFWNSTHDLVSNNKFYSMGISLLFYNSNNTNSQNVVWGNYFYQSPILNTQSAFYLAYANLSTGLVLYSGHNLIYNNYFDVQNPAYNPGYDVYTGTSAEYLNTWNISKEPLSYSFNFNGFSLSGNVIYTGYQGGNFWYNFNGQIPFNNFNSINQGGDQLPLNFTQVPLFFNEHNLPPGTNWTVKLINPTNMLYEKFTSNTSETVFFVLPGIYNVSILPVYGYTQNISTETLYVLSAKTVSVSYSKLYNITFYESGLSPGTQWSITMNGLKKASSSNNITFEVTTGNYTYQVSEIPGYRVFPSSGYVNVTNTNVTQNIEFKQVLYNVTFTEKGISSGIWSIRMNGITKNASVGQSILFSLPNGTYEFFVSKVNGYTSNIQSGYIYINNSSVIQEIDYSPVLVRVIFTETGFQGTAWSVEINGQLYTTTFNNLTLSLPYGTYYYKVITPGYLSTPSSGSFTLNGTQVTIGISFTQAKYQVTFIETGLPSETSWKINFNGNTYAISNTSVSFLMPNGTYPYYIISTPGYNVTPESGNVVVNGVILTEDFTFIPLNYTIKFVESGLPPGSIWSVSLNGVTKSSSSTTIVFTEHYGSYSYTITFPSGYTSSITSGNISSRMLTINPIITLPTYSTGISPLDLTLIIIVVLLVVVAIAEAIYFTRKKHREGIKPWTEPEEKKNEKK